MQFLANHADTALLSFNLDSCCGINRPLVRRNRAFDFRCSSSLWLTLSNVNKVSSENLLAEWNMSLLYQTAELCRRSHPARDTCRSSDSVASVYAH